MMDAIVDLFARYAKDGVVRMEYETAVAWGACCEGYDGKID